MIQLRYKSIHTREKISGQRYQSGRKQPILNFKTKGLMKDEIGEKDRTLPRTSGNVVALLAFILTLLAITEKMAICSVPPTAYLLIAVR